MKIIIDAMGGDTAPLEIVKGALLGMEHWGVEVLLTGDTEAILRALRDCGHDTIPRGMEIVHTTETVEMCDDPSKVFRHKKDTSMGVGLTLLRDGKADALVSAGSTGALLAGATLITKRIRGIRRAAMAPVIPTTGGKAVLIDCGANAECTPEYLMQFAYLGSFYASRVLGLERPRVGLLNIGAEDSKGTDLQKQTLALLRKAAAFQDMLAAAARALTWGGSFCLVHRPDRLADVLEELRRVRLEPKRLRFVHHTAAAPPSLFLLEARLGGGVGLTVEPPLLLHGPDGGETEDVRRAYFRDKEE